MLIPPICVQNPTSNICLRVSAAILTSHFSQLPKETGIYGKANTFVKTVCMGKEKRIDSVFTRDDRYLEIIDGSRSYKSRAPKHTGDTELFNGYLSITEDGKDGLKIHLYKVSDDYIPHPFSEMNWTIKCLIIFNSPFFLRSLYLRALFILQQPLKVTRLEIFGFTYKTSLEISTRSVSSNQNLLYRRRTSDGIFRLLRATGTQQGSFPDDIRAYRLHRFRWRYYLVERILPAGRSFPLLWRLTAARKWYEFLNPATTTLSATCNGVSL